MTAALALLPPVVDQTIQRVPLDPFSALGFIVAVCISAYLGVRKSPWIAALLAFAVPFAIYRDVGQTTLTLEKSVAFGSAIGLLMGGAPLWPRSAGARRLVVVVFGVLAAIALSSLHAVFPVNVAREFFKEAEYLVLLWCAATCIERVPQSARYFSSGIVAAAAIVSTLAVMQALFGGAPSGMWVNGHVLPRATGTLEGPNQLAGFLEAALPVLWIWPMLFGRRKDARHKVDGRHEVDRYSPAAQGYVTAVSSAAMILTQSRAGIAVAALTYALLWRLRGVAARASAVPVSIGAAAGILITMVWFVFIAHASWSDIGQLLRFDIPGEPGGVGTRAQLWPAAIALFAKHPVVGVGAGNFELLLPTVGVTGVQTHAASLPLQTLAEQGVVGFMALIAFAIVALRETFRRAQTSALALAAFLAVAGLLAHQLVDDLFFFPKAAALCWLLLGAGTAREPS
ncbi:MAG TPA: O-antigen ligase family protein [Candidatus Acidoferrales bacterium]|nr:O-antigen ligase family protein [Candidatus Acidoferrales bacterium]